TRVDGDHVLAFGHPALLTGATRFPMARAKIHLTLPSLEASTKISRVLETIGTFDQSRLSGISGEIGPTPKMIPVRVEVAGLGGAPRVVQSAIFEHREMTPLLVGVVTLSSLVNTPWSAGEMTLKLSGRIAMEGHDDVHIEDLYTSFSDAEPAGLLLARDVRDLFGAVYQNRFERPEIRSVDLKVSAVESPRLTIVEGIYPSRTQLDAGEEVEFTILLRSYQGETSTRRFTYRVPETMQSGLLLAQVGSASSVAASERPVVARQVAQAGDLDELITLINRLRPTNALCLKINRRGAGAVVRSELLPALPPSVFSTIGVNQGRGEVTTLMETTIHEESIPLDQIVVGGTSVLLRIR
ncbi:MAG TPA: hypothetical protein VFG76_05475, partial [Candidatus Polarisedimenticolia bacterium]|nr:hypothetical protein [Candidatus Polarisedimenticolia bacterium]